jgi:lysophospholipase L1-like esterase
VRKISILGLGDSLTQGVGDPRPGIAGFRGQLDGWLTHFSQALDLSGYDVELNNLALAGCRVDDVLDTQLPRVAGATAEIAACFIGVNNLWDVNISIEKFAERYDLLAERLSAQFPVVVVASLHDIFAPFRVKEPTRVRLLENIDGVNNTIRASVVRHGLVLMDFASRPEVFTRAVRSVDFLHPNRYGHQLIAAEVLQLLQKERGMFADVPVPSATPIRRGTHDIAHIAWVSGYVKRNWRTWRADAARSKAEAEAAAAVQAGAGGAGKPLATSPEGEASVGVVSAQE